MTEEVAKKVARRLGGKPRCPNCGYTPPSNDTLPVSDWNLMVTRVSVNDEGELEDPDFEMTSHWKGKEKVTCPKCGEVRPMEKWGLRWSWEK